jgi:hypothetical protein
MSDVPTFRLYLLRGTYLLMVVGLSFTIWPGVVHHSNSVKLMKGVVSSLLAALSILAAFGIRYPLKMLPVLLFELLWKTIWLTSFALPLWLADQMDPVTMQTVVDCALGVFIPFVIPWRYVFASYVKMPGDRWK